MNTSALPSEVRIVKDITGAKELKETHISYALLADAFVYKIKKPVYMGFLDYRNLKSRRAFCILEKDLNERFSRGIYLDVLKLIRRNKSEFVLVPLENSLPAVEYVLKMKRIPDDDFLSTRVAKDEITPNDMREIGRQIGELLQNLEPAPADAGTGLQSAAVLYNVSENFSQTEKYAGNLIDVDLYNFIKKATLDFAGRNASLFDDRSSGGYVKNGHGDLRLEHIYFNPDGSVGLIDCIEFNKRFRYADVIAEAAFLTMEIDQSGLCDYADAFISGFLPSAGGTEALRLLNFYKSYYAYVRAKVTCFLLDDKTPDWDEYETKKADVSRLIDMAAYYTLCAREITTPVFYGLMGTGKSRNAKTFAARFPVCWVSSDETRKSEAGLEPGTKVYLPFGEGFYSKERSVNIYGNMGAIVEDKARTGRGCVVDASFSDPAFLSAFEEKAPGKNRFFMFTAPENLILARLRDRMKKSVFSDGRPQIYEDQKKSAVFPLPELVVETTGPTGENAERIFKALIK